MDLCNRTTMEEMQKTGGYHPTRRSFASSILALQTDTEKTEEENTLILVTALHTSLVRLKELDEGTVAKRVLAEQIAEEFVHVISLIK